MSAMQASVAVNTGALSSVTSRANGRRFMGKSLSPPLVSRSGLTVRCEAGKDGLREAVDRNTKVDITREDVLRNMEQNESEKKSVFGTIPSSGAPYPRPEIERRPETGDKSLGSLFMFDGAAPETINGRLAAVGFVWALLSEKATGLGVWQQLFNPGAAGLVNFVAVVQIITFASIIPLLKGESPDSRRWGPFTARAERWNGRLAMIGFASLLIDEAIRGMPFLNGIH
ncbi:hypothetical protein R1sor_006127 [Riccia sorocarpa]|uniref:Early light-induced protein n=1 Tax=Riccia sorocarpa TaxID=122646 RepID=A0ABD3HNI0_9MARC